jgi:hypothetical protein
VITASESTWKIPFSELGSRTFAKLVTVLRREGAGRCTTSAGRPSRQADPVVVTAAHGTQGTVGRQHGLGPVQALLTLTALAAAPSPVLADLTACTATPRSAG